MAPVPRTGLNTQLPSGTQSRLVSAWQFMRQAMARTAGMRTSWPCPGRLLPAVGTPWRSIW